MYDKVIKMSATHILLL